MKANTFLAAAAALLLAVSCCGTQQSSTACNKECKSECSKQQKQCKKMKYQKKYTNADFYKDGKFDQAVALESIKDLIAFYDLPYTDFMKDNLWVTDFGLGDFENVGMGGIFWVNNKEGGYFAHAIYLLPGQMIPEHAHVPTDMPAKNESWMVTKGWCYNFSEVGEPTPNAPKTPESYGPVKSKNFVVQNVGDIVHLKKLETFHFLMAGDEGAIVDEWASFHDNAGLRFTNTKAAL